MQQDSNKYTRHTISAARIAPDAMQAQAQYKSVIGEWQCEDIAQEIQILIDRHRSRHVSVLLHVWLDSDNTHVEEIMAYLDRTADWLKWPRESLEAMLQRLDPTQFGRRPALAIRVIEHIEHLPLQITIIAALAEKGVEYLDCTADWLKWPRESLEDMLQRLDPTHIGARPALAMRVIEHIEHLPLLTTIIAALAEQGVEITDTAFSRVVQLTSQTTDAGLRSRIFQVLHPQYHPQQWGDIESWITLFANELGALTPIAYYEFWKQAIQSVPTDQSREVALERLTPESLLRAPELAEEMHATWSTICLGYPMLAARYLLLCETLTDGQKYAESFLTRLRVNGPATDVYLASLRVETVTPPRIAVLLEMFAPEIAAESPEMRLQILKNWTQQFSRYPNREALISSLWPLAQQLLSERSVGATARELWGNLCQYSPQATRSYLDLYLYPTLDIKPIELLIEQIRGTIGGRTAYTYLRQALVIKDARMLEQYLHLFNAEFAAESIAARVDSLIEWIMALSNTDVSSVLITIRRIVHPLFTPSHVVMHQDIAVSLCKDQRKAAMYLVLAELAADGDACVEAILGQIANSKELVKTQAYQIVRNQKVFHTWERLAGWLKRYPNQILTEPDDIQLELIEQGVQALETAASRNSSHVVLRPLVQALLKKEQYTQHVSDLWRDICRRDPEAAEEYLRYCDEVGNQELADEYIRQSFAATKPPRIALLNALQKRSKRMPAKWSLWLLSQFSADITDAPHEMRFELFEPMLILLQPSELETVAGDEALRLLKHAINLLHSTKTLDTRWQALWPSVCALMRRNETMIDVHRIWRPIAIQYKTIFDAYNAELLSLPACEQLADELLDLLIESNRLMLLSGCAKTGLSRRMRLAAILVDRLIEFTRVSRFDPTTKLNNDDIPILVRQFAYRSSSDEADMLVAVLTQLRTWCPPAYLTPLSRQVEAAIHAGRFELARRFAASVPTLTVGKERLSAEEYIQRVEPTIQARTDAIPKDYLAITKQILGKGTYAVDEMPLLR